MADDPAWRADVLEPWRSVTTSPVASTSIGTYATVRGLRLETRAEIRHLATVADLVALVDSLPRRR